MTMHDTDRRDARILVVDDETHIVDVVALKLRNAGFEVVTASDGEEALAALAAPGARPTHEAPFDLVVTDLQMPVVSGLALARAMLDDARLAAIPVLMLTARGHLLREGESVTANIVRLVHKPFSPRALLADVEELLAERREARGRAA
ncbi:MAG: Alkaline phosphatase synthesis transcriptional regulatory protein PhoP [Planctomycetota bacterium]|jgi:DNA-binding response OmpR family regulator